MKERTQKKILIFASFGANVVAGGLFWAGSDVSLQGDFTYTGWGGVSILFGKVLDWLFMQLTGFGSRSTVQGELYTSVLSRYGELVIFSGICWYLTFHGYFIGSLMGFLALIGLTIMSYLQARTEALGLPYPRELMPRTGQIELVGGSALLCCLLAPSFPKDWILVGSAFRRPSQIDASILLTGPLTLVAVVSHYSLFNYLHSSRD